MYRVIYEYIYRRIFAFFALNTFYISGVRISVRANVIYSMIDWVLYLNYYKISNNRKFYYLSRGIAFDPFADGLKQCYRRSIKKWLNKQIFTEMFDTRSTENLCSHNNSSYVIFLLFQTSHKPNPNLPPTYPKHISILFEMSQVWYMLFKIYPCIRVHICEIKVEWRTDV